MGLISSAITAFVQWLKDIPPVRQGFLGGARTTLLSAEVLKPARACRRFARVLAGEISLNAQIAGTMQVYLTREARHVPSDFGFVTGTFTAVANRVGKLPTRLVTSVMLCCASVAQANELPPMCAEIISGPQPGLERGQAQARDSRAAWRAKSDSALWASISR
jgi:hypothetical protein